MKVIFTEGSLHHLKTMDIHIAPREGEEVVVDNRIWIVGTVTHLPKVEGVNDNEDCCGWDLDRNADMTIHLVDRE
jgi:hypothetical protein